MIFFFPNFFCCKIRCVYTTLCFEIQRKVLEKGDRVKASPDGYVSKHKGTIVTHYKNSPLHYLIKFDDKDFKKQFFFLIFIVVLETHSDILLKQSYYTLPL